MRDDDSAGNGWSQSRITALLPSSLSLEREWLQSSKFNYNPTS